MFINGEDFVDLDDVFLLFLFLFECVLFLSALEAINKNIGSNWQHMEA